MAYPVIPVVLPHTLNGVENGKLSNEQLQRITLPGITFGGQAHPLAARAWNALVVAVVANTGQTLTCSGNPYRSYQSQLLLFLSRYEPVSQAVYLATSSSKRKFWAQGVANGYPSNYWRIKPGVAMAGVPGTSNHGLGLAFDSALFVGGKIVGVTSNPLFWAWMSAPNLAPPEYKLGTGTNVESFGFSWEAQSEPWHLRYWAAEFIPQRVRDIENFLGGLPA